MNDFPYSKGVSQLIAAFNEAGWVLITAADAYSDPIAEIVTDTLFLGQGQVAAKAAPEEKHRPKSGTAHGDSGIPGVEEWPVLIGKAPENNYLA